MQPTLTDSEPAETASGIEFSVLVTCHYEERSIEEFYRRLAATLEKLGRTYEIILVNDGSRDGTWGKLKGIFAADLHVHAVLDLFKNSGQQAAVTVAINESRGRAIVLIDSDLQLMPEELPILVAQWDKGFDLVTGYRVERKDSFFRIAPSLLANMIMRRASQSTIRDFGCTFKIFNADLLRAFQLGPRHVFSNVEAISRIDRIIEVPVSHQPRRYGRSGWTFRKLMKYNTDNMVVLSERPFQFLALICLVVSVLFGCRLIFDRIAPFRILPFVSHGLLLNVMVASLLANAALISLIGEFVIRSFFATRNVPLYIVREALRRSEPRSGDASGEAEEGASGLPLKSAGGPPSPF